MAGPVQAETCKAHGVWFDAGDLPRLLTAVAEALGKPVPETLTAVNPQPTSVPRAPATAGMWTPPSRLPRIDTRRQADPVPQRTVAHDVVDAVMIPISDVASVVTWPVRKTLWALGEAADLIG